MPDETIKLLLDMGLSAKKAEEVARELDKVKVSAKGAAGTFEELETRTYAVGMAGTAAMGEKSANGRGIMGASYAIQDFVSVATSGGGIVRALGAITNNFDQLATAAGASVAQAAKLSIGFTGFVAILPVVIPLFKSLWESVTGGPGGPDAINRALDAANERLNSLQARAEATAKAFERMSGAPTTAEAKGAKALEQLIIETPTEAVERGLTGAIAGTTQGAKVGEATRQQIANLEAARNAAVQQKDRDFAQGELDKLILEAKRVIAEENRKRAQALLGQAVQPGGAGAGARQQIAELAQARPDLFPQGFASAVEATAPEAIRRQERFEKDLEARKQVQARIKSDAEARNRQLEESARAEARGPAEAERQTREQGQKSDEAFREAQRLQKQMDDQQARDADKQAHESMQLGRSVNRALERDRSADRRATQAAPGRLPLLNPNADAEEFRRTVMQSQILLEQNAERDRAALQAARRIRDRIRVNSVSALPP